MKKLLLMLLMSGCLYNRAQPAFKNAYRLGIKMGLNLTTVTSGRAEIIPRIGFEGGAWIQVKLNQQWTAQAEALFVEKGTRGRRPAIPGHYVYWMALYYLELPLLAQYHPDNLTIEFGPGIGFLMKASELSGGVHMQDLADKYPFNTQELSMNAGLVFSLSKRWDLGFRLTSSLLPVRPKIPGVSKKIYNVLMAVTLAHQLKLKKPRVENDSQAK